MNGALCLLEGIPSSELGAGDGSSYGYVEAFGSFTLLVTGDKKPMIDQCPNGLGDTIALVAQYNDSFG